MSQLFRVLLVDDDQAFWKPMGEQLVREGFSVETATSGRKAIAKVKTLKGEFDVAVIDQVMGPPNGTEIMLKIREFYPSIETIILTGWGDMKPGERAMELGAFRYISKPVSAQELALNIRCAARFGRERQRSLALQTLISMGQRVGKVQSEAELYQQLYEEASNLLPKLDGFLISHFDEQEREVSFPFCYRHGKRVFIDPRQEGNSITEYVLRTGEPLLLPDGDKEFREVNHLDPPDAQVGYSASELVVPMILDGRVHGTIFALTSQNGIHYTSEHLQVLQAFANQVAISIRNVQQLKEASQLRDATAALAKHRGKEAVLLAIVEEAHKLINSDFTSMILQEKDGLLKKVHPVIPYSYFDRFDEPRQQNGVTRAVINSREPKVIWDTHKDPLVKDSVREAGIRSMLALPLTFGDRVLGVLYAHTITIRHFNSHDVDLWASFAIQAAAALDRALKEEMLVKGYVRLANELGTLNEKNNLQETMIRVATAAKEVFESDTCWIAYVNPPTEQVIDWAWALGDLEEYRSENKVRPDGLTNHVLRTKEPLFGLVEDMKDPHPVPGLVAKGLKAIAVLPLIYNNRTVGILHCHYLNKRPDFDEQYKTLIEAFCARAAIALDRARRDHISQIWRELDRKILTCKDLKTICKLFTEHAQQALCSDFSVFYSYDLNAAGNPLPLEKEVFYLGKLQTSWQPPRGGAGGGVYSAIKRDADGLLIVNNLDDEDAKFSSNLGKRERIKAFIAIRLDAILPNTKKPRVEGILFLNYRKSTAIELGDLTELRYAGDLIASAILRLSLEDALERALEQKNNQLRAVIDIFREFEEGKGLNLDLIAQGAVKSLGMDLCTFLEFDSRKGKFTRRGTYGLLHPQDNVFPRVKFKEKYMDKTGPTIIPDVRLDKFMRDSNFVRREGIEAVVVYPLRMEGETLGLFFANYRHHTVPTEEDLQSIGLFADLATIALGAAKLRTELNETQLKLARRYFLVWVSMIEDIWRHSLVQKASAIRNYTKNLQKRVNRFQFPHGANNAVLELINHIDRLATEIADAPPRVPHYWEMLREPIPIASVLQEVAERASHPLALQVVPLNKILIDIDTLGGVQVFGYRRWIIYLLEALLQNARNAMRRMQHAGVVTITGTKREGWAEIRITDNGKGVSKEVRKKLFRELIPKKKDRVGLGVGSLLAATIVEEHGGSIELEKPGPGDTTILIRLPIALGD